jgi:hypothetical protein
VTPKAQTEVLKSFLNSMVTDNNHSVMEAIAYGYASIFEEIDDNSESITIPLPTDPEGVDKVAEEVSQELETYKRSAEVTKGAMAAQTQAEEALKNKTEDITADYEREKQNQASDPSGVM